MNLKVGIFSFLPGWEIILKQEGIPFEIISLNSEISVNDFSVIIVTELLSPEQTDNILDYLSNGGSVLLGTRIYAQIFKTHIIHKKIKFLIPEKNSIYSSVGLVDIYSKQSFVKDKYLKSLDSNLKIYKKQFGKGTAIILPFTINKLVLDYKSIRKKFLADRKELPSEIIAKVSKSKIRQIIRISLEYLFNVRNLPFIQSWYFPKDWKNLFIFRIDTDFCTIDDAKELYEICKRNQITATWFLDTESEEKLQFFRDMENQELALHCERHIVFNNYEKNYNNLKSAKCKLEAEGIHPVGFAAPFGDWNPELGKTIQELDFEYSSEFVLDYDDLPFFPFFNNKFSKVLQIPIHPISIGRLRRSHFSKEEMLKYYLNLIEEKINLNEPIIIYHHPHHEHFEVINEIFKYINKQGINNFSIQEYASWWEKRSNIQYNLDFEDNKIKITQKNPDTDIFIKIKTKTGFTIYKAQKEIVLDELNFITSKKIIQPGNLARTRKKNWRDLLYNYESFRGKIKL